MWSSREAPAEARAVQLSRILREKTSAKPRVVIVANAGST
jgi:hypothetical protein